MGVCTHTLRFVVLQLKVLIYHGVTLGQLLLHHSFASGRAARVKQFWLWAGNEDFGNHLLHVLTFAYTKIFEERAAPKARIGMQVAAMLAALRCHLPPTHFLGELIWGREWWLQSDPHSSSIVMRSIFVSI